MEALAYFIFVFVLMGVALQDAVTYVANRNRKERK